MRYRRCMCHLVYVTQCEFARITHARVYVAASFNGSSPNLVWTFYGFDGLLYIVSRVYDRSYTLDSTNFRMRAHGTLQIPYMCVRRYIYFRRTGGVYNQHLTLI
jgi:hypothetical protein